MTQIIISSKYQVVIPKKERKKIKVKPGEKMDVDVSGNQIILTPVVVKEKVEWPEGYYKKLGGLLKINDVKKYIDEERNSWEEK